MDASLFTQGILIGLTLAIPVGPISLLCIHRAVNDGRLHGIISGIGIAVADSFYAAVAILGLTMISGIIIAHQGIFRILAGIVLIIIGIKVFFTIPPEPAERSKHESYLADFLTTAAIGIANPLTIVFFIAILPGFGVVYPGSAQVPAMEFIAGVFSGSAIWWVLLCGSIGSFRSRLSRESLKVINRGSGIMIAIIGVCCILSLIVLPG